MTLKSSETSSTLHDFFPGSILSCGRAWTLLTRIDAAEADRCRLDGCPHCGGCLDSAPYPRKPHGLAASLRAGVLRFSFCCRDCRRRQTPPSARFFGRRFRVAPAFLAASVAVLAGGTPLEAASRMSGVPVTTLRRWRRWWREMFPKTRARRLKRGELAPPPGEAPLVFLVRSIRGRSRRSRLLRSLVWLRPWTGGSGFCAFGDGRGASAEDESFTTIRG